MPKPKYIYVVIHNTFLDSIICGAYSTEELAWAAIRHLHIERPKIFFDVIPVQIDEPTSEPTP